jgi:putative MATE family efflux protein
MSATETTPLEPTLPELRRNILTVIWPVTVESILQMSVGFVNTAMVGQLGASVILAVGLSGRVSQIVWALISAIGTGATVLVARAIGAGDEHQLRRIAEQSLLATLGISLFVTLLAFTLAPQLLHLFGAADDVVAIGTRYLRLLAFSMPFQAFYLVISALLRGTGNTRTPMIIAFVINGVNAMLNWILIFGHLGFPALGFRGSAIATIAAQLVGATLAVWYILSPGSRFPVRLRERIRFDRQLLGRIIGIGLPSTAESFFWQAGTIILLVLINSFGTIAGAAHQLGLQAEGLSYMPAAGFGIAAMAFVGQSLGARNIRLAERYVKEITIWVALLTVVTASMLFFLPRGVMRLLTRDNDVIALGARYLMLMACAQIPQQIGGVLNGTLRGAGDTRTPMFIAAIGIWVIRLPLAFLLSRTFHLGIVGVWWAMTLDLFVRFIIVIWRFSTGRWKTIQL